MFNPGITPMSPAVVEHGPAALRAVAAADGLELDAVLRELDALDLQALWEAAQFLADAVRLTSRWSPG
jgi:hypothetical protein